MGDDAQPRKQPATLERRAEDGAAAVELAASSAAAEIRHLKRDADDLRAAAEQGGGESAAKEADARKLKRDVKDAELARDATLRELGDQEQRFTREVDGLQRDLAARDEESDVRRRSSVIVSESQVASKLKADVAKARDSYEAAKRDAEASKRAQREHARAHKAELEDARRDAARDAAEVARLTRDLDVARDGARSKR
ncbi:hypothetical protein JL721_11291 [Aureococcus anophagefferens]|nr:hypothetical protein JL721_11291 [Aureococcus anophagefferens]